MNENKLLAILLDLSNIYNIMGDDYRSNAYYNAYFKLKNNKHILDNLINMIKDPSNENMLLKELKKIKGIGESISTKIIEFMKTGSIKFYNDLKNDPDFNAVLLLSTIMGIGYKNAKYFVEKYDVRTIDELRELYVNGDIKNKFNRAQILGLKFYDDLVQKIPKEEIKLFEHKLKKYINDNKLIYKFEIMGSYKRGKEFSRDIDLLVYKNDIIKQSDIHMKYMTEFIEIVKKNAKYVDILSFGSSKFMGLFILDKIVRHVDILIVPMDNLYTSIQYFTGSKEFNVKMRQIAKSKGFKLNEKGLFKNNKQIKLESEKDIFKILDINYIDPKYR